MSDESEQPGQRIKAWLIGCEAPGVGDDVAALAALLEGEFHPEHREMVEVARWGEPRRARSRQGSQNPA